MASKKRRIAKGAKQKRAAFPIYKGTQHFLNKSLHSPLGEGAGVGSSAALETQRLYRLGFRCCCAGSSCIILQSFRQEPLLNVVDTGLVAGVIT